MSVIFSINLKIVVFFLSYGRAQKVTPLPFPHLVDFNESDIGKPFFIFEGVDYELIPKTIYKRDFITCSEEYARCTRFLLYANPVCGYHTYENRLKPYYSLCELDYASCNELKRRNINMYGTTYRNRGVFFMGEGNNCEMYLRRIAGGEVPRDIRDAPKDESERITAMKHKYDVTRATDLQNDMETPDYSNLNSDYDFEILNSN